MCTSFSDELISDAEYYDKGVSHYKNAEFDKAYVVFFNLAHHPVHTLMCHPGLNLQ